jgi:predicted nucleic acid-binding protein
LPILFDSSVYISALRARAVAADHPALLLQRWARESPLWLSSVVLEELYAGSNPADRKILEKLERDFEKANRVLVPNLTDWSWAGRILAAIAHAHGYEKIGRARLTNDALIAASAARTGIQVMTKNARDFALVAQFCPLQLQTIS